MSLKNIIFNSALLFLLGCQSSGGGAKTDSNLPPASLDKAVKVSFLSSARDAVTGETIALYQVLLSRSWCELKGREVKDQFAAIVTPAIAFDIDDALMDEFQNYMVERNFLKLPDGYLDMQTMQYQKLFPTILSLETATVRKDVVISELPADAKIIKSIGEIEKYFHTVTALFPPTKLEVNVER